MAELAATAAQLDLGPEKQSIPSRTAEADDPAVLANCTVGASIVTAGQPSSEGSLVSDQDEGSRLEAKKQICFDFTKGTCTRGEACKFSHDIKRIIEVNSQEQGICFDFLRGACSRGAMCRFSHDLSNFDPQDGQNSRTRNSPICYDFVKKQCSRGAECRYSHDLDSIVNSTRGRGPIVRHPQAAAYSWAVAPQLIAPNVPLAALPPSCPPIPGMILGPITGAGLPDNMLGALSHANYISVTPAAQPGRAAAADIAALQALASAAADPRNGHIAQAQILQQMQGMLVLMQQQQQQPSPARQGDPSLHTAQASALANGSYADPARISGICANAVNGMQLYGGPTSALHSPALAGVAQQLVAQASPHQQSSTLNANAASFIANSHANGIGAFWSAHAAKAGSQAFQYVPASRQDSIPAVSPSSSHPHPSQPQPSPHPQSMLHCPPDSTGEVEERQPSIGAESIRAGLDLGAQHSSLHHERARADAPVLAADPLDDPLDAGGTQVSSGLHSSSGHAHLLQKLPAGSDAPFGTSCSPSTLAPHSSGLRHGGDAGHTPLRAELRLNLQARGELPAVRIASPQSFAAGSEAGARPGDVGEPLHPCDSPYHTPTGATSLGHSRSTQEAGAPTLLGLDMLSPFREDRRAEGVPSGTRTSLPRHLSMDVGSMRHMGLQQHASDPPRLGHRQRQSSLGSSASYIPAIAEEVLEGSELPSLGHASSLSDGLQHLNICQHIWRCS